MVTEETVIRLTEEYIRGTDVFLVEVAVKPGNQIRVHVDRPGGITIDECVEISRYLNGKLDREIEDYSLEVSSPGLAPFRVKQQYEIHRGREVDVQLNDGSRHKGVLKSVSGQDIVILQNGREKEIGFGDIKKTKPVISFK